MDMPTLATLRRGLKAIDPGARISRSPLLTGGYVVRTADAYDEAIAYMAAQGFEKLDHDITGPAHDWTYVITFGPK